MKVPQCTTGRVFLLKFKDSSSRKFFYWMQEPSEEKDEEIFKKVRRGGVCVGREREEVCVLGERGRRCV